MFWQVFKENVDFLNQLNTTNFSVCLVEGEPDTVKLQNMEKLIMSSHLLDFLKNIPH